MTDCSFNNPCERGVCEIDEEVCRYDINPDSLIVYINKKPFTGSLEAIKARLSAHFADIERAKCSSGSDIVGALPGDTAFADFSDGNLNEIRSALEGEDVIGFYNLDNGKIMCEVASSLFKFWDTKRNHDQGIVVTTGQIEEIKTAYRGFIESGDREDDAHYHTLRLVRNLGEREYFVALSPFTPQLFIRQQEVDKIIAGRNYFFLMTPTNRKWIDMNSAGIGAHHNFFPNRDDWGDNLSIIIPIGSANRKELVEQEEEKVEIQVIEESGVVEEIRDVMLGILDGADSRALAIPLDDFTRDVREHLPNVHPEKIQGVYARLINQRKIKQFMRSDGVLEVFFQREGEEIDEEGLSRQDYQEMIARLEERLNQVDREGEELRQEIESGVNPDENQERLRRLGVRSMRYTEEIARLTEQSQARLDQNAREREQRQEAIQNAFRIMRDTSYEFKPNMDIFLTEDAPESDILVYSKMEDGTVEITSEIGNPTRNVTMDQLEEMLRNWDLDTIEIVVAGVKFQEEASARQQLIRAREITGLGNWRVEQTNRNTSYATNTLFRRGGLHTDRKQMRLECRATILNY